jgi:general secretion pathway protein K
MIPAANERGAALLTVLMLVAVIAVLATAALERLKLGTHLASNSAAMAQARAYAMAGERIAISRVAPLTSDTADRTFLAGGRSIPFPVDGGIATARISDGGNCFNLNSVVQGNPQTGMTIRPVAVAQFTALMDTLGILPASARIIAASLVDWIDSDTVPQPGGAEDAAYMALPNPHRAANVLMADVSELREVSGVEPEIYAGLLPFICALPNTDLSSLTVNTLTADQAPLVAMLIPGRVNIANARAIIESRPVGGFADINAFWSLPALAGVTPSPEVLAQPKLKPRWFALRMSVIIGSVEFEENALIDGARQPAKLIQRRYGEAS